MVSEAHGADADYRLNDEARIRERLGASAMAERYISQIIKTSFPGRPPSDIRVLDVGTGQGLAVKTLRELGYDAYGLEPGGRFSDMDEAVRPYVYRVFSQDLERVHPEVEKFDLLFSNGVVEHVGTTDGNAALVPNYIEYRDIFVRSQLSLLRVGGILVIIGPNRLFPFDFQHGDHYYGIIQYLDNIPFLKYMTIPWHPKNHLCSYNDIRVLAEKSGYDVEFIHTTQEKYCSLTRLRNSPVQRSIFKFYVHATALLPFYLRQFFEPHTVFICRLVA